VIYRPRTGRSIMNRFDIKDKYEPIRNLATAEQLWIETYEAEEELGGHRVIETNMISGNILPLYNVVENVYRTFMNPADLEANKKYPPKIGKAKIESEAGGIQRFLGIIVPNGRIGSVLRNIKLFQDREKQSKVDKEAKQLKAVQQLVPPLTSSSSVVVCTDENESSANASSEIQVKSEFWAEQI